MRVEFFSADLLDGHSVVFVTLRKEVELNLSAERLVQQRLFQVVQYDEFSFIDGGEALGFGLKFMNERHNLLLFRNRW